MESVQETNVDFNILTPNGMLGYGYRKDHFWYGVEEYKPVAIIVDSGSTDGGPYKLGMNRMTCGRESYVRDLTPMLEACHLYGTKVLIGSAGGDGSNSHVAEMIAIIEEIAQQRNWAFKVAKITQDVRRTMIKDCIQSDKCYPCGPLDPLSTDDVDNAVEIVGQMGAEPFLEALKGDPDIIIAGRSYDPSTFAAFSMHRGVEPSSAWHMGKIMECGGMCAIPKGRSMIARMKKSSFELTPLSPLERCTSLSVAAHTLYEKTRPDRLPGPGGALHLDNAKYEELSDGRTVRITGAEFVPTPVYQIKLEGVQHLGHRTIFIGGIRDPILISQIDDFLEEVRKYTQDLFPDLDKSEECKLVYHIYGKNAVMGQLEPESSSVAHEIGVMGEVIAPTQARSQAIANNVRTSILHMSYPGQVATTGNFASPLSPHEQDAGQVFKFSVYHLIDLAPGEETTLFPITFVELGNQTANKSVPRSHLTHDERQAFLTTRPEPLQRKAIPEATTEMCNIAKVIRSKNSGPFELTLDIMFDSDAAYSRVKSGNILTNDVIKKLYRVEDQDILINMFFDPALAWKCTLKRPWAQGSVGERDTLGTQQHAPLLSIMVPPAKHIERTDSAMETR